MNRVIIISPYTGKTLEEITDNINYARKCMLDSLNRGESPIAFHLLYPQVLDDKNPPQRKAGMKAGHLWIKVANYVIVYEDIGISQGMQEDIDNAERYQKRVVKRKLYE